MKQLVHSVKLALSCLAIALVPTEAMASPSLAKAWGEEAASLKSALESSDEGRLDGALKTRLERFGRTATRLSKTGGDDHPLPKDLGCILRGMAEETENQIEVLDTADTPQAAQEQARSRLVRMLNDAVMVSEASEFALSDPASAETTASNTSEGCTAEELDYSQSLAAN